jgi:capsular polysaccharide biosynthesis protein
VEETLSLQEILKIIKKRLLLIISLAIVAVGIAVAISFYFITPIYQAQTQILVNPNGSSEDVYSMAQIETDLQLINTYNDIITTPIILNKVIEELQIGATPEQLTNQITLLSGSDSKVLKITVEDPNPEQAVNIANTTAEVFKYEIPLLMNIDNVNILSAAKLSETPTPVKPNKSLNLAIGAVIGIMLGIGLTFLLEILDTTIKDEKDVEEILGIPIMGVVGSIPLEKEKKSYFKSRKVRRNLDAWIEK